jgi:hypothetical protein
MRPDISALAAAILIVSIGSLGPVFAGFCEQGHYLGDVNGDAVIDIDDVRHLAQHELGRGNGALTDPGADDIDLDGRITGADLALLVQGAQRRQGLALELRTAQYCCPNPYQCPVVGPLPRARVEARIEGRVVSRTMTDDLGHAYLLLPPGTFDVVVYPPAGAIDASLTATQVREGLTTIQPAPYESLFAPGQILVAYDVAYPWERMLEIFAEQGVTSWWLFEDLPGWVQVFLPDCLHTMEALETWRAYPEVVVVQPNLGTCVQ